MDGTPEYAVQKVITLVAASDESWEDAARVGVTEASKTIRDLAVARVVEKDVHIAYGSVIRYRVKLQLAFRVDRRRPSATAGQPDVEVTRYLMVANETLGTGELVREVDRLLEEGPCEFHLLVPATHSKAYSRARRLSMLGADPVTGLPSEQLPTTEEWLGADTEGMAAAERRLDAQLAKLKSASYDATGEIGDPDPIRAIHQVLTRSSFDVIILSTLPAGISRWLKADLPSRVRREFGLPVIHVPGQRAPEGFDD